MIAIYKVTNPAGEVYYGQTTNYLRRVKEHKAAKNKEARGALPRSIREYGADNHKFEVLHTFDVHDQQHLNYAETYYIRLHELYEKGRLLNFKKGGHTHKASNKHTKSGWHHSPETIAKIQRNRTKGSMSPEGKARLLAVTSGSNNYAARAVVRFNLNGEYLDEWGCIRDAKKFLGIGQGGDISRCCKGKSKYARGFKWMYKEDYDKLKLN